MDSNLKVSSMFREIEETLRTIMVPGFDIDVIEAGIVRKLRLTRNGTLVLFVDYTSSDPGCNFCRFINDQLWRTILGKIKEVLEKAGYSDVVFIDYRTKFIIEYE